MSEFVAELDRMIVERKKMTSPLYQTIVSGKATARLLRTFVVQRWPIKNLWTRNILGIASRVDDHRLRSLLVENIYEEETGALSGSRRHLETFADFGRAVGVTREELEDTEPFPETTAVVEHNIGVCNDSEVHFTAGVASVLLLMEGQPPIVNASGSSMLTVMRDAYRLPDWGYEFFVHHASANEEADAVSELEDEHAAAARELLVRYCDTDELRAGAKKHLARALDLRHQHFDAILREAYSADEPVFRHQGA
ncbi:pyrroloquinoline quinone biosynthesis protein PqqC [Streptomyces cinnamoneus]|uniref:Pyrroloquinoline quinone biosynthesis protein PqqC n=1 Tax=Streptomyces cinnamoneus TaxID=53446 RepID=A0A2G1X9N1_STRCJ|nr:iron-containing redox enzyme family protein [Streptomyces cinnamoneus]PHQ47931.1 pyrroloquinoline quinone biosynthesis protein PqqC [Streptomyces cinnamoneus]PPT15556.1 iron-containing redox enzyme family protein [Streptomyces cinnamoneus]